MGQSYLKNAALLTGADVLLRLAGMGLRIYLANALGGEGMGLYQLVLAVYALFVTLATAGVSVAATRLEAVAESLSSLAETVNAVYDAFPRRCDTFRWVIDNTHDSLCFNCGRRETCWKQEYTATLEGMNALRPILEQQGHLQASDLPGQLSRCIHPAALCAAANRSFALYRSRKEAHVHAEAMRTALTEQYSAMADALSVLSEQLGRPGNPEPYKSGRVAAFLPAWARRHWNVLSRWTTWAGHGRRSPCPVPAFLPPSWPRWRRRPDASAAGTSTRRRCSPAKG